MESREHSDTSGHKNGVARFHFIFFPLENKSKTRELKMEVVGAVHRREQRFTKAMAGRGL